MSSVQALATIAKEIGLEGKEIQEFIKEQQDRERDEREQRRQEREQEQADKEKAYEREQADKEKAYEREQADKEREHVREMERLEKQRSVELAKTTVLALAANPAPRPQALTVPKYSENQTDVHRYLDIFEGIMKENRCPEESWSLSLRSALLGTSLEEIISTSSTYDEMKEEILLSCGHSPEQLWKEIVNTQQGEKESFRQWCTRTKRRWNYLVQLARKDTGISEEDIIVKFLILDRVTPPLRAHLIQNKAAHIDLANFQETGVAFQEAYGRSTVVRAQSGV